MPLSIIDCHLRLDDDTVTERLPPICTYIVNPHAFAPPAPQTQQTSGVIGYNTATTHQPTTSMDFMNQIYAEYYLDSITEELDLWVFAVAMVVFLVELARLVSRSRLDWRVLGDSVANFITFVASLILQHSLLIVVYIAAFRLAFEYLTFWQLPNNIWVLFAAIVAADFAFYWEHRFSHRTNIGWATHSVHHSSPYFNISVAYRFGPLDGFFPLFFNLPLVFMGFNPSIILLSAGVVKLYQTLLHTDLVGKLPRPIEAVMNTPSHHRVHHGTNPQYIDRNYAGIFIIWDRLFDTFAEEREAVVYGITRPINSINPLVVFGHGFTRLYARFQPRMAWPARLRLLFRPPEA